MKNLKIIFLISLFLSLGFGDINQSQVLNRDENLNKENILGANIKEEIPLHGKSSDVSLKDRNPDSFEKNENILNKNIDSLVLDKEQKNLSKNPLKTQKDISESEFAKQLLNETKKDKNMDLKSDELNQEHAEDEKTHELSFISLYQNAHIVVKIVVYILSIFSILTWAIFIYKFLRYAKALSSIKKDIKATKGIKKLDDAKNLNRNSFAYVLVEDMRDEIKKSEYLNDALKNRIKYRIETRIAIFLANIREGAALLASISSSAPFIGLFGTVWGIMNSFIGIASTKNASLSVVAPGIAEALFATAFGLAAAIPAVLFYNYLVRLGIKFANLMGELATNLYIVADRDISKD